MKNEIQALACVRNALAEDIGSGDISALLLPESQRASADVLGREKAVVCGQFFFEQVFRTLDSTVQVKWFVEEGQAVEANERWCEVRGLVRALVTGERTALNFLQTLSGTATTVNQYVAQLKGLTTQLLDTRKTIPGLRMAQKYAVTIGGGVNHRMGLYDAFLIKENHIIAAGSLTQAVEKAKQLKPDCRIIVEVETLAELKEALATSTDQIMLDNFTLEDIQSAVEITQKRKKLEVSGGVTLENIRSIAETGVEYISVGSLTKNLNSIDLSFRLIE